MSTNRKFFLGEESIKNRAGVHPKLIEISDLAITLTLIDFGHGPYSGLRSTLDQSYLHTQGKSKADGTLVQSKHQYGTALDFYAYVDGKASWEPEHLAMVAAAFFQAASILGHRIKWGGLWEGEKESIYGWDMPHIELL